MIFNMINQKYKEYADLKAEAFVIEEKLKLIGEDIKEDILANNGDVVETSAGSFYITRRKKWQYSEEVKVADEYLKDLKRNEEEKGVAEEISETVSLTFRGKK